MPFLRIGSKAIYTGCNVSLFYMDDTLMAGDIVTVVAFRGNRVKVRKASPERFGVGAIYEVAGYRLSPISAQRNNSIKGESKMDENKNYCADCGAEIGEDDEVYALENGNIICEACYFDGYITCEECGKIIPYEEAERVNDGNMYVCQDCAVESGQIYHCSYCDRYYTPEYSAMNTLADGEALCDTCRDQHAQECCDCGRLFLFDDMVSYEDDYGDDECYCPDCDRSKLKKRIHNYSYKPEPKFKAHNHDDFWTDSSIKELLLGVELEIDKGNDPEEVAGLITDACDDVYCKHDGSLKNGVEIVSHPCTLEYHLKDLGWDEICAIALENEFSSHNAGTCGLHVHVGRRQLGRNEVIRNETVAKIILLVQRHWDNVLKFSRRKDSQLNWAEKPDVEYTEYLSKFNNKNMFVDYVYNTIHRKGRYQAVNLQNINTIEFRIFNGSLMHSTVYATLQFVSNVCKYAMTHNFRECLMSQWNEVAEYEHYDEITEYLNTRNLSDVPNIPIDKIPCNVNSEFKIGDRVRVVNSDGSGMQELANHIGEEAVVAANCYSSTYDYGLDFGRKSAGFHDLNGKIMEATGYWVYGRNIELVEESKSLDKTSVTSIEELTF